MADEDPSRAWRGSTTNLRERDEEALDADEEDLGVLSMSDDEGEGTTRLVFFSFRDLFDADLVLTDILRTSIMRAKGYQAHIHHSEMSLQYRVRTKDEISMKCIFFTIFYFIPNLSTMLSIFYFSMRGATPHIVASDPRLLSKFDIRIASFVSCSNDFSSFLSRHLSPFLLTTNRSPFPISRITANAVHKPKNQLKSRIENKVRDE